jgi:acetyltransferase-like isoleucine patch superfamily enzyme
LWLQINCRELTLFRKQKISIKPFPKPPGNSSKMALSPFAHILEHAHRVASALRVAQARATGTRLGPGCRIGPHCDLALGIAPHRRGLIELGHDCVLAKGVIIHPHNGIVRLGRHVFLGPYCVIYGHGGVEVGSETLVSMHCRILSSNHAIPPAGVAIRTQPDVLQPTRIGRDVWLGAGVTVLGGVTIGDGCIVGAGAVVSHDLPPGAIAVGIPAHVMRYRI